MPTQHILDELEFPVSIKTAKCILRRAGLCRRVAVRKFEVKPEHEYERFICSQMRLYWSINRWKRLVFTDEAGMDDSDSTRVFVTRRKGTRFDPANIHPYPNRKDRVNYFGYKTALGQGKLTFYPRMNASIYNEFTLDDRGAQGNVWTRRLRDNTR